MTCVTKYVSVKKTGVTKSQIGDVQRWEKKDRRPILIGGGVVFLLLILAGAFFIGLVLTIFDTFSAGSHSRIQTGGSFPEYGM